MASNDRELFPRDLAAIMVDMVREAPIGTTEVKDVPFYSPAIMYAYSFVSGKRGGTDGKSVAIAAEIVEAFTERVAARIESLGRDEARKRYAHTKESGWTREAHKAGETKALGFYKKPTAKKKAS